MNDTSPSAILSNKLAAMAEKKIEEGVQAKASELAVPYADLRASIITPEAVSLLPEEVAKANNVGTFFKNDTEIYLAALEPADPQVKKIADELKNKTKTAVTIYLVSAASLAHILSSYSKVLKTYTPAGVVIAKSDLEKYTVSLNDLSDLKKSLDTANLTEKVVVMIAGALPLNASDIHVEAEQDGIAVRYRIDGVLHNVAELPEETWKQLIARLKLLSHLKINVSDRPQDGRFTIDLVDDAIDVRVSTIPTTYGESVVIRLLRSSSAGIRFEDLGIFEPQKTLLLDQVKRPNGMVITTGPTGSGKTTTLYALLNLLNTEDNKIITLEDPIEYKLKGINQSQVDHSKGYSFADGLRSILRQDPDVVMVGEIRDLETAEVALNAALTGHIVLSTIHTNSAAAAIPRFLAMGVKPFLLGPALNATVGQRLVRRLCEKCKKEIVLDEAMSKKVSDLIALLPEGHEAKSKPLKFLGPVGCTECYNLGFKGRIGIYEILPMSEDIEKMIQANVMSEYQIQDVAQKAGMITMAQDGIIKALNGITSLDEVFQVAE